MNMFKSIAIKKLLHSTSFEDLEQFDSYIRSHLKNKLSVKNKHEVPRIYSYRDLDINLFDIETKEQVDNIIGPMIDTGNFMNDFCKWEKKMIICSDSQYGEPLPENIEFAKI